MKISATIIIFCLCKALIGQIYMPFRDNNSYKWGVKNTKTDKIILSAKYPRIQFYNDSIFVLQSIQERGPDYYAIIDTTGKFLIDYTKTTIYLNEYKYGNLPFDTVNYGKLIEIPYYKPDGEPNKTSVFFIDYNRNCIITDYYLCPSWRNIKKDNYPSYLQLLQKGELQKEIGNIDSALYYCKQAILCKSDNPFAYYWGATLLIDNFDVKLYKELIEEYLDKCEELEIRYPYIIKILKLKHEYYKHIQMNKQKAKLIKERLRELKKKI